jgi:hypothetical protein
MALGRCMYSREKASKLRVVYLRIVDKRQQAIQNSANDT